MLYLFGIVLAILAAAILVVRPPPRRYAVKASRPDAATAVGVKPRSNSWWFTYGLAVDEHGNPIETSGRFVGTVTGESMTTRGLPNGATFVADYLNLGEKARLQLHDIVVVKDSISVPASEGSGLVSKEQYCLRSIRSISGSKVEYEDDNDGAHDPHTTDQVIALVTRVIPQAEPKGFRGILSAA